MWKSFVSTFIRLDRRAERGREKQNDIFLNMIFLSKNAHEIWYVVTMKADILAVADHIWFEQFFICFEFSTVEII